MLYQLTIPPQVWLSNLKSFQGRWCGCSVINYTVCIIMYVHWPKQPIKHTKHDAHYHHDLLVCVTYCQDWFKHHCIKSSCLLTYDLVKSILWGYKALSVIVISVLFPLLPKFAAQVFLSLLWLPFLVVLYTISFIAVVFLTRLSLNIHGDCCHGNLLCVLVSLFLVLVLVSSHHTL